MFVGRKEELEDLETLWRKRTSSIVACRGRRRIGKSTLFREFARRTADVYIEIECLAPQRDEKMTNQAQLDHFVEVLSAQTGCEATPVESWYAAFCRLDRQIDENKKTVILLDEISWMGGQDPNFPGKLRTAWETLFHRHEHLILCVCGSVSSWIHKNILNDTGFTGRFSRDYVLKELPLSDCAQFWRGASERLDEREIFDVLSVTGGVPRYLEEVDAGFASDENIRRMCFLKSGELYNDFNAIFNPIFGSGMIQKRLVLETLADGPQAGVTLAERIGIGRNGRFSDLMKELCEAGFVDDSVGINPETGREGRLSHYRLRDNYIRFYLKYIAPHQAEIERGTYRYSTLDKLPGWSTIMGLQFENLIVNNAMNLVPFLHLGGATVMSAAPYRHAKKNRGEPDRGCQVDLLIQTQRTAYVVEIKRKKFIDCDIEKEVENKIRRIPRRAGLSLRPVLVYDGELNPSIEGDGYFDAIIPAKKLLVHP